MKTPFVLLAPLCLLLSSCSGPYYKALETVGIHKRDLLIERVLKGKESQLEAKEQLKTTMERFVELTGFKGGDLEKTYERLNREYERSVDRANEVQERIDAIEDVSRALFKEWKVEIKEFKNAELKHNSQQQLRQTQARYEEVIAAMKRAAKAIDPVLATFRDQVLTLKHNLNAQAIASLDAQKKILESDIASLVAEMEKSIAEADAFIESMRKL
jgi:hypothetical protein